MLLIPAVIAMFGQTLGIRLSEAKHFVRGVDTEGVDLKITESHGVYSARLSNHGATARIGEVVLFDIPIEMSGESALYGEGFTMLSQTGGTIAEPVNIGAYTDHEHYRLPVPRGATTVYNLLTLTPPGQGTTLFGFTTCKRFSGHFNVFPTHVEVVLDAEGLSLANGESWDLEEFTIESGNRPDLLSHFGDRIAKHVGRLRFAQPPTGWCSWQTFGPEVTAADVSSNVDAITKKLPGLHYIQIDDGYQAKTGDWLETGASFGGGIQDVLKNIRAKGLEPAIWIAPFVATADSKLFQQHPDWFVMDDEGKPLRSDRVTFGGWHRLPWYCLDGTNPGAQGYLEHVFKTMRERWGCTYFKMDAIVWGAIKGGHFHDPKATRVEAFRRGMEAIRRGAGHAFLLGGNHPNWLSIGLIDGQRSGMDIDRSWDSFSNTARENLSRAWQNGKLWWNDPDTILLTGNLPEDEFRFHATIVLACGGLVLSGDDVPQISPAHLEMIWKLLPPTTVAATFTDSSFTLGKAVVHGETRVFLLNWTDQPVSRSFEVKHATTAKEFWTDQSVELVAGLNKITISPRSAQVLVFR